MYSKSLLIAIATLLLCTTCATPWASEPIGQEVNLAFIMRNNLLFLPSATVDGKAGRFLLGVANARTALDSGYAATLPPAAWRGERSLQLTEKEGLRFTPVVLDMHHVADGIIGADVWGNRAISIDYASGLLTYQKEGIHPEMMTLFHFAAEPRVVITVDGKQVDAVVDTASPDTMSCTRACGRTDARARAARRHRLRGHRSPSGRRRRAARRQSHPVEISGDHRLRKTRSRTMA